MFFYSFLDVFTGSRIGFLGPTGLVEGPTQPLMVQTLPPLCACNLLLSPLLLTPSLLLLPPLLLLATALPTLQVSRSSVQRRVPMRLQVSSTWSAARF